MLRNAVRVALCGVACSTFGCGLDPIDALGDGHDSNSSAETESEDDFGDPPWDLGNAQREPEPGDLLWSERIGGTDGAGDIGFELAFLGERQVVVAGRWATGDSSSDAYLVGLDRHDGSVEFERRWSGAANALDAALTVVVGPEGLVFAAGDLIDTHGEDASFVAGVDVAANIQWLHTAPSAEDLRIVDLVATQDGRLCAGGHQTNDQLTGVVRCYALTGAPAGRLVFAPAWPHGHSVLNKLVHLDTGLEFLAFGMPGGQSSTGPAMAAVNTLPSATSDFDPLEGDPPTWVSDAATFGDEVVACGKRGHDGSMELGRIVEGQWRPLAAEATSVVLARHGMTACSVAFDGRGHVLLAHGDIVSRYAGTKLSWTRSVGPGIVISDIGVDAVGDIYAVGLAPGRTADDPSDIWVGKIAP